MSTESAQRILVVANRTASTPAMLGEVQRRAKEGARFVLLIPPVHPDDPIDWSAGDARALLERAGAGTVEEVDGGEDAALRVHELVHAREYDAVIVSTVQHHLERWRHHDRVCVVGIGRAGVIRTGRHAAAEQGGATHCDGGRHTTNSLHPDLLGHLRLNGRRARLLTGKTRKPQESPCARISSICASSITVTPSSRALSSLLPASAPATT